MKILLTILAVLVLAATAVAAPGPVQSPPMPEGYMAIGPQLKLTAQPDTVWTTAKQLGTASVAVDFDETAFPGPWLNPAKMRIALPNGTEPLTRLAGFLLWSSGVFSYQGFAFGDSIAVSPVYVDTTLANAIPAMPRTALAQVLVPLDTLRVHSFISTDTVFVQAVALIPD